MKKLNCSQLTMTQLRDKYAELIKEQFNLRFQRATGQLEKPMRFRAVRRDIARVLTFIKTKGHQEGAK